MDGQQQVALELAGQLLGHVVAHAGKGAAAEQVRVPVVVAVVAAFKTSVMMCDEVHPYIHCLAGLCARWGRLAASA